VERRRAVERVEPHGAIIADRYRESRTPNFRKIVIIGHQPVKND
jgi:hypothetical protein